MVLENECSFLKNFIEERISQYLWFIPGVLIQENGHSYTFLVEL